WASRCPSLPAPARPLRQEEERSRPDQSGGPCGPRGGGSLASRCPSPQGASSSTGRVPGDSTRGRPVGEPTALDPTRMPGSLPRRRDLERRHVLEPFVVRQVVVLEEDAAGAQSLLLRLDLDAQDDFLAGAEAVDLGEYQQRQRLITRVVLGLGP